MKISDRKEFASKAPPLTCTADATVFDAVQQMAEKNYGSIIVTDAQGRVEGMMTERDIFRRLIAAERDPKATHVREIMTSEVRMARPDDDLRDWLRIMSNERFRRLPIVDADKKLVSVMSQGDFVSYTWPDLINQVSDMAKATIAPVFNPVAIILAILGYTVVLVIALSFFT